MRNRHLRPAVTIGLAYAATLMGICSCDPDRSPANRTGATDEVVAEQIAIRVFGKVRYVGEAPEPRVFDIRRYSDIVTKLGSATFTEEIGLVGPDGEVENAFVWIESRGLNEADQRPMIVEVKLSSSRFRPLVAIARPGDTIRLTNDDDIDHVFVVHSSKNLIAQFGRKEIPGDKFEFSLQNEERFVEIHCQFHPFEDAFLISTSSDACELTDVYGAYEIDCSLPPGKRQVFVSHPRLGSTAIEIDVKRDTRSLHVDLSLPSVLK